LLIRLYGPIIFCIPLNNSNSNFGEVEVEVKEKSRIGRPQRVAPTGFRRGRSPCLPENLTFWVTLTHSRRIAEGLRQIYDQKLTFVFFCDIILLLSEQ
jgi:hypothetical protein